MNPEPRFEGDYTARQVQAARRVLVDVGQVLASFRDAMVVIGGWVPDLLLPGATPEHIGSIDVDLALDAARLGEGRYADLLKLLLDTGRYEKGEKDFQLVTTVDLRDNEVPVRVDVEFLAPAEVRLKRSHPEAGRGLPGAPVPRVRGCVRTPREHRVRGPDAVRRAEYRAPASSVASGLHHHESPRAMHARRAFELVQKLLSLL